MCVCQLGIDVCVCVSWVLMCVCVCQLGIDVCVCVSVGY